MPGGARRQRRAPHPDDGQLRQLQIVQHQVEQQPAGADDRGDEDDPLQHLNDRPPALAPLHRQIGGTDSAIEFVRQVIAVGQRSLPDRCREAVGQALAR